MATPSRAKTTAQSSALLLDKLSAALPKGYRFGVYHLSTPPTKTDALYSAPPEEREDKTYCERHFLAISIDVPSSTAEADKQAATNSDASKPVLILALEVFVYTTAYSSTFFVAKADSTGYLKLLNLPKGTPSPIKEISSVFVSYLVEQRSRKGIQSVVSLFARAQDQYLFPGSVEYAGKHVLDDRGLVKWWCRVLDPLLEKPPVGKCAPWGSVKGYLVIPGLDSYETKAFLPKNPKSAANWVMGHALEKISHYTNEYDWVPARCLIPRFPDDPKSRFRDELDEETGKSKQLKTTGQWKSVKSLDTFWEMMAYRQECSSGRLTGFIWVVFDTQEEQARPDSASTALPTPNPSFDVSNPPVTPTKPKAARPATPMSTPRKLFPQAQSATPSRTKPEKPERKKKKKKTKLTGVIKPRQPRIKTQQRNYLLDKPISTAYYYWPAEGRGRKIVDENDYKRVNELLLRLDFSKLDIATRSTRRWISEVGMGDSWGLEVLGKRDTLVSSSNESSAGAVNNLASLIKRKRTEETVANESDEPASKVNVLSTGLIRRKAKEEPAAVIVAAEAKGGELPKANVLGAGLVRK
ncbi:H3 K56 histone acetylation protein KAT11 [Colletotrichum higginsianum]|uniref:histone acetyltransferase n=2 Tax=Colletotrichum higginsianum TaxID=80884 RepID=H1V582_COLHI|nr:H3 K56 histone acetylation protein KAT11 [Colletotrichum higginsianum IMI 349063]OBR11368.1 H3 K56 histone acetylation protein KAT11 [Colletotrichum higginsianum IMI 349063]TID00001.1 Histone acetyltransferase [Colletotrichum higginsianum]CCF35384.1 H3 K56 histone acetylation protein KAT11 [Colletotrichum higginsianum]